MHFAAVEGSSAVAATGSGGLIQVSYGGRGTRHGSRGGEGYVVVVMGIGSRVVEGVHGHVAVVAADGAASSGAAASVVVVIAAAAAAVAAAHTAFAPAAVDMAATGAAGRRGWSARRRTASQGAAR